jgi:hypothetical protein
MHSRKSYNPTEYVESTVLSKLMIWIPCSGLVILTDISIESPRASWTIIPGKQGSCTGPHCAIRLITEHASIATRSNKAETVSQQNTLYMHVSIWISTEGCSCWGRDLLKAWWSHFDSAPHGLDLPQVSESRYWTNEERQRFKKALKTWVVSLDLKNPAS